MLPGTELLSSAGRESASFGVELEGWVPPVREKLSRVCVRSVSKRVAQLPSSKRLTLADRLSFLERLRQV